MDIDRLNTPVRSHAGGSKRRGFLWDLVPITCGRNQGVGGGQRQ